MAHEVTLNINSKFVLNKDIEVEVKTDEGKLGTLLISKGNVEWKPVGNSRNKKRLTWTKFAALLESEGKAVKVAKPVTGAVKKKADTEFATPSKPTLTKVANKAPRKPVKKSANK